MPAKAPPLAAKAIELFKAWIDQGLAWEEGFSFSSNTDRYIPPLKPRPVELPPERDGVRHPIDRIVAAYFDEHKLAWPPELDDAGFARRASLDMIGLLPAPGELSVFLAGGFSDKREQFVRGLLDGPTPTIGSPSGTTF
jgi:hypothetical protein